MPAWAPQCYFRFFFYDFNNRFLIRFFPRLNSAYRCLLLFISTEISMISICIIYLLLTVFSNVDYRNTSGYSKSISRYTHIRRRRNFVWNDAPRIQQTRRHYALTRLESNEILLFFRANCVFQSRARYYPLLRDDDISRRNWMRCFPSAFSRELRDESPSPEANANDCRDERDEIRSNLRGTPSRRLEKKCRMGFSRLKRSNGKRTT